MVTTTPPTPAGVVRGSAVWTRPDTEGRQTWMLPQGHMMRGLWEKEARTWCWRRIPFVVVVCLCASILLATGNLHNTLDALVTGLCSKRVAVAPLYHRAAPRRYRHHPLSSHRVNVTDTLVYDAMFGVPPYAPPLPFFLLRRLEELQGRALQADGRPPRLHSATLYGGIYSYAYYFASILVGTPPQRQSVILDTGSSLLGFPCLSCRDCGRDHIDQGFNFTASSTAAWIACGDQRCHSHHCSRIAATSTSVCSYEQGYTEGSSIEGNYFSDLVALGDYDQRNPPVRFDYIGCHSRETRLFSTQKASGIMGVSYPKHGTQDTIMDAFFKSSTVDAKVFSICVAEEGGVLTVGGYNATYHRASRTTASTALRLLGLAQALRLDGSSSNNIDAPPASRNNASSSSSFSIPPAHPQTSTSPLTKRLFQQSNVINGHATGFSTATRSHDDNNNNILSSNPTKEEHTVTADKSAVVVVPIAWTQITSPGKYEIVATQLAVIAKPETSNATQVLASTQDFGPCIVDSGTTFSYFPPSIFRTLMSVLENSCRTTTAAFCLPRTSMASDGLCWHIETPEQFDALPIFLLQLHGGATVQWKAYSYLHQRAQTDVWCVAVDDNRRQQTVLGMSFMKQKDVIFDRASDLIGFVEAACPIALDSARPPPPPTGATSVMTPTDATEEATTTQEKKNAVPDVHIQSEHNMLIATKDTPSSITIWAAAAGVGAGVLVLAVGIMVNKARRARSRVYEPVQPTHLEDEEEKDEGDVTSDIEMGLQSALEHPRAVASYHEEASDEESFNNEQFNVIEAELDALERTTKSA